MCMEDAKVLLAVPNVSEGRDEGVMEQVERAFAPALFLDIHADADHGRAAYTLAAEQGKLAEGLVSGAAAVVEHVDLTRHDGSAPPRWRARRDARRLSTEEARGAACAEVLAAAGRIGAELDVPVILYGELATVPEHRERSWLRKGGWRHLAERIESGVVRPDFGPARAHPTAGVVLAAARPPLVAFNLDLRHRGRGRGQGAAAAIRESGGGLPGVRAIGLFLESRGRAQVSTNVHDYRVTPLRMVVEEVRKHADIAEAELIGLAPAAAFQRFPHDVPIRNFSPERHLLENALRSLAAGTPMAQTKKKRTRKHRGTPAGTIERAGRTGSSRTRVDAKQVARDRRAERLNREPTWRGAVNRAAIAAAVFGVLVVVAFGRAVARARSSRVFMFVLYIPLGLLHRQGDLQLPPAKAQRSRWTSACSPSGRCRRTPSCSAATAPTAR